MDLVIALEMSRLQMIEDEMKKRQRAVEDAASKAQQQGSGDSVGQPGTSVESNNTPGEVMDDHQLKLAIQLSLQETTKKIAKSTSADPSLGSVDCIGDISSPDMHAISALKVEGEEGTDLSSSIYHKTSADLTVDYFLKSLAGRQIDLKNLNTGPNMFSPDDGSEGGEVIWGCGVSKTLGDKELLVGCGFKPCIAEDGRFEIGDIHENGCFNDVDEYDETDSRLLKRSHSTGDLCTRGRRGPLHGGVVGSGDEPRYHLDSDHSSQHEEKPEDIAKRILAFPAAASSAKSMSGRHFLLLHHHSGGSNGNAGGETSLANSEDGTTTEDDEEGKGYIEDESSGANSSSTDRNSFSEREIKPILSSDKNEPSSVVDSDVRIGLVSGKSSNSSSIPVVTSVGASSVSSAKSLTGNSLLEAHRKAFKAAGGKTGGSSGSSSLRIRICKSPNSSGAGVSGTSVSGVNSGRQLETDSSNEYESETGIPKSPTLFISGVSISRTPEPRSPAIVTTSSGVTTNSSVGRQSRSSSLTVPPPPPLAPPLSTTILGSSSMSLNTATTTVHSTSPEPQTPMMLSSSSPVNLTSACVTMTSNSMVITPPPLPPLLPSPGSPISISSPRSDGALSSVLHVQESNLSSDDFHEALFLLERSPKGGGGSSKRRKKSKKERHKDKENSNGSSCSRKETIEDEPRSGRSSTNRTPEMIEKVRQMLPQDRRLTLRLIAEELDISKDTVHTIICDDLDEQKAKQMETSGDFISMCDQDPLLLKTIVTGDETWCNQFDPESKRQSMSWCSQTSPRPKKKLSAKIQGQSINAAIYQSVLNRLLQRIRRVRPELHRTGKWMLLHDNAAAHCAIRVRQFLAQKMVAMKSDCDLETISKGLLWNRSQNGCHTIFDGIHVRKTYTCTNIPCVSVAVFPNL
ncbi:hypothetical protein ANN_25779 [Periplaneta americana]|uniref:Uncharacterized protein n=1 Tax=Periplaneta americana TaxID=6978 RepID=A0ABQ8S445_PERAM|nr:hypothetical protein ANN_25779 [Periplaneta americana]